jgi:ATP-binding cassette subfamily C (CFTR/MRP) protein 1
VRALENKARPIALAHVTTTMQGLQTVRSMDAEKRFISMFEEKMDAAQNHWKVLHHTLLWQTMVVDIVTCFITFGLGAICVENRVVSGVGLVSPSVMGLVMGNSVQIVVFVGWVMRAANEVTSRIGSVSNAVYYGEKPEQEAVMRIKNVDLPPNWPSVGVLDYEDAVLHYLKDKPPVLKHVTLNIPGGCKVGIVGKCRLFVLILVL